MKFTDSIFIVLEVLTIVFLAKVLGHYLGPIAETCVFIGTIISLKGQLTESQDKFDNETN